jgi:hypothetical protein
VDFVAFSDFTHNPLSDEDDQFDCAQNLQTDYWSDFFSRIKSTQNTHLKADFVRVLMLLCRCGKIPKRIECRFLMCGICDELISMCGETEIETLKGIAARLLSNPMALLNVLFEHDVFTDFSNPVKTFPFVSKSASDALRTYFIFDLILAHLEDDSIPTRHWLDFNQYLDVRGDVFPLRVKANMFRLLVSADFQSSFEKQKIFMKLFALATNEADIVGHLNRISEADFATKATAMKALLDGRQVDVSTRGLRKLALEAVLGFPICQEDDICSCWLVAPLVVAQSRDYALLMRFVCEMLTGDTITCFCSRSADTCATRINVHVRTEGCEPWRILQTALVYAIADACLLARDGSNALIDVAPLRLLCSNILCMTRSIQSLSGDMVSLELRDVLGVGWSSAFSDCAIQFSSKVKRTALGGNRFRFMNRDLEGDGFFFLHTKDGVAITIDFYRKVTSEIIGIAGKQGGKKAAEAVSGVLRGLVIPKNALSDGGDESATAICLFGRDALPVHTFVAQGARGASRAERIFRKWHGIACTSRKYELLASGNDHAYVVDFSMVDPEFAEKFDVAEWPDLALNKIRGTCKTIFFINALWDNGGTPFKIGVRYHRAKLKWVSHPSPTSQSPQSELVFSHNAHGSNKFFAFLWDDVKYMP